MQDCLPMLCTCLLLQIQRSLTCVADFLHQASPCSSKPPQERQLEEAHYHHGVMCICTSQALTCLAT